MQANPAESRGLDVDNSGIHSKMKKKLAKKEKAAKRAKDRMGEDQQCCKADGKCAIF